MFVSVMLFDKDINYVCGGYFVRKNKASLTRKVNDVKRYISGYGYDLYGPLKCAIYVNDCHYCDIHYDPNVYGKVVVSYVNPGIL